MKKQFLIDFHETTYYQVRIAADSKEQALDWFGSDDNMTELLYKSMLTGDPTEIDTTRFLEVEDGVPNITVPDDWEDQ